MFWFERLRRHVLCMTPSTLKALYLLCRVVSYFSPVSHFRSPSAGKASEKLRNSFWKDAFRIAMVADLNPELPLAVWQLNLFPVWCFKPVYWSLKVDTKRPWCVYIDEKTVAKSLNCNPHAFFVVWQVIVLHTGLNDFRAKEKQYSFHVRLRNTNETEPLLWAVLMMSSWWLCADLKGFYLSSMSAGLPSLPQT